MREIQVPEPPIEGDTPRWAADSKAVSEEKNWDDEGLLKGQEIKNNLLWLKTYGWLVVGVTVFLTLMFTASLGIWAWHYLMPEAYCWLSVEQLSKIQSTIFSGSLGAIVTSILRKHIDK